MSAFQTLELQNWFVLDLNDPDLTGTLDPQALLAIHEVMHDGPIEKYDISGLQILKPEKGGWVVVVQVEWDEQTGTHRILKPERFRNSNHFRLWKKYYFRTMQYVLAADKFHVGDQARSHWGSEAANATFSQKMASSGKRKNIVLKL